ncbi:uncharacterized protein SPSK_00166 [Sporothrix schenckii 1099-18]|uniref:ABM domain-containing protein n=1 Tax=Sporothrix schenckii 1099-18 TaxID=1397361 RepID=A0A0F2M229_SPOSC|nr:uncharacterized protein SPSK_00166 [Sporothrix schenckii 1099-18]KJR83762.1 hypothetical protein SPSK_00166 [Sporothrix schenckii 1099-18]
MGFTTQDDKLYLFAFVHFLPGKYNTWQGAYDELAKYVWAEEPTTETYYFGIPCDFADDVENTPLMFAFEVYDKRDSLYHVHFTSPTMQTKFIPVALPNMTTGFDLQHYARVGGFLDRPGDGRACGFMYDVKIKCTSAEARDRVAARLTALAPAIEAAAPTQDGGILTWVAFASQDVDTDARLLMRFRDKAAFHAYTKLPAVLDFWAAGKEEDVDKMEQRGYVENGKGWLRR